jgi:hypothetical protein
MNLADEALRNLMKDKDSDLSKGEVAMLNAYKQSLDASTKFIPIWVKISVAIALGLGTMVGWKRIVITVREKIGKTHLTYGQGAAAELVAAATMPEPTCPVSRSRPPMSCRQVSQGLWRQTDRVCSCRGSATSPWPGF